VEHGKLAPRGENTVYIGTGMVFDRRAFLDTHPDSITSYGYNINVSSIEQQVLYNDMPDATIADLVKQLQLKTVPHNTTWTPLNLLQVPVKFETDISPSDENFTNNKSIFNEEPSISGDLSGDLPPTTHSRPAPDGVGITQNHSVCCVIYCHSKFLWSKLLAYTTYYDEHALNTS
jgi:hypothetical protein